MYYNTMNVQGATTKRRLVQLRISDADYDVLKKYAAHLRIPITSAIRMIVIQKIEEAKNDHYRYEADEGQGPGLS